KSCAAATFHMHATTADSTQRRRAEPITQAKHDALCGSKATAVVQPSRTHDSAASDQSTANTQIEPPCGTSGYAPGRTRFSRSSLRAASTPQPLWTATYCLPSTWNDIGTPLTPDGKGISYSTLPLVASSARNLRSLVPPSNNTSPPVANSGPQFWLMPK